MGMEAGLEDALLESLCTKVTMSCLTSLGDTAVTGQQKVNVKYVGDLMGGFDM